MPDKTSDQITAPEGPLGRVDNFGSWNQWRQGRGREHSGPAEKKLGASREGIGVERAAMHGLPKRTARNDRHQKSNPSFARSYRRIASLGRHVLEALDIRFVCHFSFFPLVRRAGCKEQWGMLLRSLSSFGLFFSIEQPTNENRFSGFRSFGQRNLAAAQGGNNIAPKTILPFVFSLGFFLSASGGKSLEKGKADSPLSDNPFPITHYPLSILLADVRDKTSDKDEKGCTKLVRI